VPDGDAAGASVGDGAACPSAQASAEAAMAAARRASSVHDAALKKELVRRWKERRAAATRQGACVPCLLSATEPVNCFMRMQGMDYTWKPTISSSFCVRDLRRDQRVPLARIMESRCTVVSARVSIMLPSQHQ
jgi:hypothetical protein